MRLMCIVLFIALVSAIACFPVLPVHASELVVCPGKELFAIDLDPDIDLDTENKWFDIVIKGCNREGLPLSDEAKLSTEEKDRKWSVLDNSNKYEVIRDNGKLRVYQVSAPLDLIICVDISLTSDKEQICHVLREIKKFLRYGKYGDRLIAVEFAQGSKSYIYSRDSEEYIWFRRLTRDDNRKNDNCMENWTKQINRVKKELEDGRIDKKERGFYESTDFISLKTSLQNGLDDFYGAEERNDYHARRVQLIISDGVHDPSDGSDLSKLQDIRLTPHSEKIWLDMQTVLFRVKYKVNKKSNKYEELVKRDGQYKKLWDADAKGGARWVDVYDVGMDSSDDLAFKKITKIGQNTRSLKEIFTDFREPRELRIKLARKDNGNSEETETGVVIGRDLYQKLELETSFECDINLPEEGCSLVLSIPAGKKIGRLKAIGIIHSKGIEYIPDTSYKTREKRKEKIQAEFEIIDTEGNPVYKLSGRKVRLESKTAKHRLLLGGSMRFSVTEEYHDVDAKVPYIVFGTDPEPNLTLGLDWAPLEYEGFVMEVDGQERKEMSEPGSDNAKYEYKYGWSDKEGDKKSGRMSSHKFLIVLWELGGSAKERAITKRKKTLFVYAPPKMFAVAQWGLIILFLVGFPGSYLLKRYFLNKEKSLGYEEYQKWIKIAVRTSFLAPMSFSVLIIFVVFGPKDIEWHVISFFVSFAADIFGLIVLISRAFGKQ